MFFFVLGVNQHVIDEHYDELVQIFHKDLVCQIHKVGRDFYQFKIHHCLLVRTIPQNEGRLQKVRFLVSSHPIGSLIHRSSLGVISITKLMPSSGGTTINSSGNA
jgi:hypothetical protein